MDGNCWESVPSVKNNKNDKSSNITAEAYHGKFMVNLRLEKDCLSVNGNVERFTIKYKHITNVKRSKNKPEIFVNYFEKKSDSILQFQRYKIKFNSHEVSEQWSKAISKQIKKKYIRIKSLLVIIDKIEHRCKLDGSALFQEYMSDIIRELKISCILKEINSTKDIEDLETLYDSMKSSNGIVIISGDETASSVISNIINIFQTDNCSVKHVTIPFTIIPTGYHNDISRAIWRNENIQNICLNIFLCKTFQADVLSFTHENSKKRFWGFNCHYGFYSILEKYRLLNSNMKENILTKKALKTLRSFDCAIQYKLPSTSSGHPLDDISCNKNCSSCHHMTMSVTNTPIYKLNSSTQSALTDSDNYETMKDSNDISWIIVNSIPCRDDTIDNAFTPACHFNNGCADMILVKSVNISDLKKCLKCLKMEGSHLKLSYVDSRRIVDVNITVKMNSSWTNENEKTILESPISKHNKNKIIVIEDTNTSSSSDQEDSNEGAKNEFSKMSIKEPNKKTTKIKKIFGPVMKACKELTKTTQPSQASETYKKPNMLESDRDRERKAEKLKKKNSEVKKFETGWMLDYNFIDGIQKSVNIIVHSGIISFFGDAFD